MIFLWFIFLLGIGLIWFFKEELDRRFLVPKEVSQQVSVAIPQVDYRIETAEESFNTVMTCIETLPWLRKYGYHVVLPQEQEFQKLYENPQAIIDKDKLKRIFETQIYDKFSLKQALPTFLQTKDTVKQALKKFAVLNKNWGFVLLSHYEIIVTPFGIEGFYEKWDDKVRILLLSKNLLGLGFGKLELSASIIHEMVHIGIDTIIVEKYGLTHWQKERLVDVICMLYLKDVMPYYTPDALREKNGDRRIDEFVTYDAIVHDLPAAIKMFIKKFPNDFSGNDEIVAMTHNMPDLLKRFVQEGRP